MNKRKVGKEKEELVANYLSENGYKILARNYWCSFAELDIVAEADGYLCFVEVKYRKDAKYGGMEGRITPKKMRNICQCARFYMHEKRILPDTPIRFDVVFVLGEEITLIKNAFDYM